jgi:hypothetical protein
VSRWFKGDPNWTVNTIANIANALNVDLEIKARDRKTGVIYTPSGVQVATVSQPAANVRTPQNPFTRSNLIMRNFTLTRVPDETPANVTGFESAA